MGRAVRLKWFDFNHVRLANYAGHDACYKLCDNESEHYHKLCGSNGDGGGGCEVWTMWRHWMDWRDGLCGGEHLHLFECVLFAMSVRGTCQAGRKVWTFGI